MPNDNSITVHVPRGLRPYSDGAPTVVVEATSVRAALDALETRYPSLYAGICDETGSVRRHINIFINTDHMRDRDGLETALALGDSLIILPAVSGG